VGELAAIDDEVHNLRLGGALQPEQFRSRADDDRDAGTQLPGGDVVDEVRQRRARTADQHREIDRSIHAGGSIAEPLLRRVTILAPLTGIHYFVATTRRDISCPPLPHPRRNRPRSTIRATSGWTSGR